MNVYLAARFALQREMAELIPKLNLLGCGVTARWITEEPSTYDPSLTPEELLQAQRQWAANDYNDVIGSDVLVFFAETPDVPGRARGGRHVEFGIALALGIPILVVGPTENIFHHLPHVEHFDDFDAVLIRLKEMG